MRQALILLPALLLAWSPRADVEIRGMKHPALSPDGTRLAFSYHGDIWACPSGGGKAERLTDREGDEGKPAWSPDGKKLAFAADWRGNRDLYVLEFASRKVEQITHHSEDDDKPAWSPDGKWIAFQSTRDSNLDLALNGDVFDLWKAPAAGGTAQRITRFRGENPSWTPDGRHILYDRYASGYADGEHDVWIIDAEGKETPRALVTGSEDTRNPVAAGETVYVSHEAHGIRLVRRRNIWRTSISGGAPLQVTGHAAEHATWPGISRDGSLLAYEHDFDFHLLRIGRPRPAPEKLSIRVAEDAYPDTPKIRRLTAGAESPAWSPDGSRIAMILESDLWVMSADGTSPVRLTSTMEEERDPAWSPDGKSIVYVESPWGGAGHVCVLPASGGKPKRLTRKAGRYGSPALSPDRTRVVYEETDASEVDLMIADAASGSARVLVGEKNAEEIDPRFSPDGRSVAYLSTISDGTDVRTEVVVLPLAGGAPKVLRPDETLKEDLAWSPDGASLAYAARDLRSQTRNVHILDLASGKARQVPEKRGYSRSAPSWSPDSSMILTAESRLRQTRADPARLEVYDAAGKAEPLTISFEIDKTYTLRDEMLALLLEVWGIYNDFYYDPFFHGVDWNAVKEKYAPIAAACRTKPEIHEVINDLIRELQSSHVHLSPARPQNDVLTGSIAADCEVQADGTLRVVRVAENGPAAEAGIKPAQVIVAVGEHDLKPGWDFDRLLTVPADRKLGEVGIAVKDEAGDIRTVFLTPITRGALRELKYRNQVARRRTLAREKSGGKLAYVHLRMMAVTEVARVRKEIEEEFPGAEGLVLDIRDGVGGMAHRETISWLDSTSPERINKNPVCTMRNRNGWTGPDRLPTRRTGNSWDKPVIMIQNEISRSDKEILPYTFRAAGVGYLVGMPTAGGVIGGNNRRIRDGSSITVSVQGWFTSDGRNMEAWGVPPDFRVSETHEDLNAARDAQLEKAIEILLAQMEGKISPPRPLVAPDTKEEKK